MRWSYPLSLGDDWIVVVSPPCLAAGRRNLEMRIIGGRSMESGWGYWCGNFQVEF